MNRRHFLQVLGAGTLATGALVSSLPVAAKPLRFLLGRSDIITLNKEKQARLTRAVLETLDANFGSLPLQFWNQPFSRIDFEKRLTNIVHWVDRSVREHRDLHPVDPLWVMAQIMAESLFYEFALSPALAAGICQFMPSTATRDYNMIIAGSLPEHRLPPYRLLEHADALDRYNQAIRERGQYEKESRGDLHFGLESALETLASQGGRDAAEKAEAQLKRMENLETHREQIRSARKDYVAYIETNITELGKRDLFGNTTFFQRFDERFTYHKPINAMVHMLANSLRVRNGNMLAAAAAYNAGLSRTFTREALYTRYGVLPNFSETSTYLGRILANYEEIAQRFYEG